VRSLRKFPDPFLAEICGQPDAIARAAGGLVDQAEGLQRLGVLAGQATTLLFTGMGASYHACYPAITELAGRGIAAVPVDTAELLHFRRALLDGGTVIVAVSQSGESAEVVRLAQEVRSRDAASRPFLATVTNGTQNSLAILADLALDTRAGSEGGPSTLTFAASLVTLASVARVLGRDEPRRAVDLTTQAAEDAARAVERLLADPEGQAEDLLAWHGGRRVTLLLGRGPARASAEMGALLLKEAAGIPAEALETAQFRHGPLELAGPDLAAIVVATEPETLALDLGLAADLHRADAAVMVVSFAVAPAGSFAVRIGRVHRALAPAVSIVPVLLLAWRLAVERGQAPGELTRAAKVTTHE
jgi:glucosamine--fructose-6-phosphate aminotransferase (isomerizing)